MNNNQQNELNATDMADKDIQKRIDHKMEITIKSAALFYQYDDYIRAVQCSKHSNPAEVVAAKMYLDDEFKEDVMFWLQNFIENNYKDDSAVWEAMNGH